MSLTGIPCSSASHMTRPGSIVPERVAMTSPSRGVNPIVVSTDRPSRTAAREAPAPRWQVTTADTGAGVSHELDRPSPRVAVAQTVEAKATYTQPFPPFEWHGVRCRCFGKVGVKGGIETPHSWHITEDLADDVGGPETRRLVERRKGR